MVLRVVFIKLTFRWLQTGLSDLKNTKQLKFCIWSIFTHFSKFFEIFEIHQYFLAKLLNVLIFFILSSEINAYQKQIKVTSITSEMI